MSATVTTEDLSCWVLSEGMAGTENQCLALADALGLTPVVKRVAMNKPWRWLGVVMAALPPRLLAQGYDSLAPPWPDLVIASGRKCAGLALAIQRASRGHTFTIFVQNPRLGSARFDLIVAPRHDGIAGANIFTTRGALSRVGPAGLKSAAAEFASTYAHLPRPLVACLIGGTSRRHRLTPADGRVLGAALAKLAADTGGSLLITPSRRTPEPSFAALEVALDGAPAYIWRREGANPYFGFLAVAEAILVTGDSVSMVSDACSSGKPVHILPVSGQRSARFSRFFATLEAEGAVRPFSGKLESWDYDPLNDCSLAADEIRRRLEMRQKTK